ncbi:MAG: thermonuclease family protein [Candidatus Hadarchaeota archaeon]
MGSFWENICRNKIFLIISLIGAFSFLLFLFAGDFSVESAYLHEEESAAPNLEYKAEVLEVIDGDTVRVEILDEMHPHSGIDLGPSKIRFAGVDAKELDVGSAKEKYNGLEDNITQSGYERTEHYREALKAKRVVENLAAPGEVVYLDIDDLAYGYEPYRGKYGRIIAILYSKLDGRWVNVNAAVLRSQNPSNDLDYDRVTYSYRSEFNPFDWLSGDYPYI